MAEQRSIIVEYKHKRALDLLDYTASLSALGEQFKRFSANEGGVDSEARLFIHEVRTGSAIAELIALGKSAADLYDAYDKLQAFAAAFYSVLQTVLHLPPSAKELDRQEIRNASNFVAPLVAEGDGAVINLIDNRGGMIVNHYSVSPMEAAAIRHNAQHLLNSEFPDEVRFENEPMALFQMRNAPPGKSGDFGIIDRFSPKERKLTFAGDAVKDAILHHDENPFDQIFWVDGVVKTVGGKPVSYLITNLVDTQARED